jgi:hypothetical protein
MASAVDDLHLAFLDQHGILTSRMPWNARAKPRNTIRREQVVRLARAGER